MFEFLFLTDFLSLFYCCIVVVQLLRDVQFYITPWTAACQTSLSFTISQSLLKLISIESATLSNHLILCHPLPLLPSVLPSPRVFSNGSALLIRWPKYWSFNFNISSSNGYSRLIPFDWQIWSPYSPRDSQEVDFFFFAFSMIQWMLTIWPLAPPPALNPTCTYGSYQFMYYCSPA